jgi:transposase
MRQEFLDEISGVSLNKLVYIDETGINQCLFREFAYAPRGQKVYGKISGKKFKRTNIVAGICQGEWVAPMEYAGTTDSKLFEYWFENCLIQEVEEDSVIVLDNATFHRKYVIPDIAEKKNCRVIFLPPYSPDLNPIEKKWAWLKKRLRKILSDFKSFDEALVSCF